MIRVGFIGLGSQGGPMARRIAEEGYPLTVWARRRGSLEALGDAPATVATSPAEVGRRSDIVGICVVADADVEDVLLRPDGVLSGLAPGGIVAIHSTVRPDTCRRLGAVAAEQGVGVVDAPVSGGGIAAAARKLLVMAGGDEDAVARCRPVFATFSDPVIHLGPLGSGQMAKLMNNLVFTAQITLAVETYSFAERLGVDRGALGRVLAHGSGGSQAAEIVARSGFDLSGLRQAVSLLDKDVGILLDLAHDRQVPEPPRLAELARESLAALGERADEPMSGSVDDA